MIANRQSRVSGRTRGAEETAPSRTKRRGLKKEAKTASKRGYHMCETAQKLLFDGKNAFMFG